MSRRISNHRSFKFAHVIAAAFITGGCELPTDSYVYEAKPDDPQIFLSSGFSQSNYFSINIRDTAKNLCPDFKPTGKKPTLANFFLLPPFETQDHLTKIPAGRSISVSALYVDRNPNPPVSCGPVVATFVPQINLKYMAKLKPKGVTCELVVKSLDAAGHLAEVQTSSPGPCKS